MLLVIICFKQRYLSADSEF